MRRIRVLSGAIAVSEVWSLLGWLAALAVTAAAVMPACDQGAQGDWCNPALVQTSAATSPNGGAYNEDECNSGLACTVPPTCVIAVCCPSSPPYSDPNCACLANPGTLCACTVQELDGGPWVSEDGGTDDAGSADSGAGADASVPVDAGSDAMVDGSSDAASDAPTDAPGDGPTDAAAG